MYVQIQYYWEFYYYKKLSTRNCYIQNRCQILFLKGWWQKFWPFYIFNLNIRKITNTSKKLYIAAPIHQISVCIITACRKSRKLCYYPYNLTTVLSTLENVYSNRYKPTYGKRYVSVRTLLVHSRLNFDLKIY